MKIKFRFLLFLALIGQVAEANMASPILEGTASGSAISSKDINILSETIHLRIDKEFRTARFVVEYTIEADSTGTQIPLLFHARDYKYNFLVWLDDKPVVVQNIPGEFIADSRFGKFSSAFKNEKNDGGIVVYWQKNVGHIYQLNELKYFEADIPKGKHKIRVEYLAGVWVNSWGQIKSYSFRYSLTPAKYWHSFGDLQVVVEQEGEPRKISSNLGQPDIPVFGAKYTWSLHQLPAEYFEIVYQPVPHVFARILLTLGPTGIWLILTTLLVTWHLFLIRAFRRKNNNRKHSPVLTIGGLVLPILSALSYMFGFWAIENALGKDAGGLSGYLYQSIFLYPVFLLLYWIICLLADRFYKNKFSGSENIA